jgi:hypothetical protein
MKTAKEMKAIAMKNSPLNCYLEDNIAPKIERLAAKGEREISIYIDSLPFRDSRPYLCEAITEYLSLFGYTCFALSNSTRVDVRW